MRRLIALTPLVVAAVLAATGTYVGAVFVLLVAAMLYYMPLLDWLYPRADERHHDERGEP